jgi:hypothetical protein
MIAPILRPGVMVDVQDDEAVVSLGSRHCAFSFPRDARPAVMQLFSDLRAGNSAPGDLLLRSQNIAEQIPNLLQDLNELRFLTSHQANADYGSIFGTQLYRELRRVALRVTERSAKSSFLQALTGEHATPNQLIGYGLEYYCLVRMAPGLIAPVLASAHSFAERSLLEGFLSSEIGHDRFIGAALQAVGLTHEEIEIHQPLPMTFAICASLGVYARQHPLSFKAALFLLEEPRPEFIEAFEKRCQALGLPAAFYLPFREHADINSHFDHEEISGALLACEGVVGQEASVAVKRHVSLLVETMICQEEQILEFYGRSDGQLIRRFQ